MPTSHSVLIVALVAVVALGGMYIMSNAIMNVPLSSSLTFVPQSTLTGAQTVDVAREMSGVNRVNEVALRDCLARQK